MKKCFMIIILSCLSLQIIPSQDDGGTNLFPWLIGAIFVRAGYLMYQETLETIDYWTKEPDLVCIDCKDPGKHANKLTKLPCGHAVCSVCKQEKVHVAHQHNGKLIHICSENLVHPLCTCGKRFDFEPQEQRKISENMHAQRGAMRPFNFTLITRTCVTGCGNRVSKVLDCGHSLCQSCCTSRTLQNNQISCPVCKSPISFDKRQD